MRERRVAKLLARIAGGIFVCIGLSHFVVPSLFQWQSSLAGATPVVIAGETIDNVAYLYLFNADLLLYEVMLGLLSFYFAAQLGRGKRSALVFTGALALFFLSRTPLQFIYFPFTWSNITQSVAAFGIALLYGYPVFKLKSGAFDEA